MRGKGKSELEGREGREEDESEGMEKRGDTTRKR